MVAAAPSSFAEALESVGIDRDDASKYHPNDGSTFSYLTPDDRALVYATTGRIVSSEGLVQNPTLGVADHFLSNLAGGRLDGYMKGEMTTASIRDFFEQYSGVGQFDGAHLDAALNYLKGRDEARRINLNTPRSSFDVRV